MQDCDAGFARLPLARAVAAVETGGVVDAGSRFQCSARTDTMRGADLYFGGSLYGKHVELSNTDFPPETEYYRAQCSSVCVMYAGEVCKGFVMLDAQTCADNQQTCCYYKTASQVATRRPNDAGECARKFNNYTPVLDYSVKRGYYINNGSVPVLVLF